MLMLAEAGSATGLLLYYPGFDFCYVSNILTVGSEPVISFFNKGKLISLGLPFCIFVTNTIYVLNETRFLVVRIAIYELFMISSDHCRKAEMG